MNPARISPNTTQQSFRTIQGRPKGSMVQRSAAGFFGFPELGKLHQAGLDAGLNSSARLVLYNLAVYVNPDVGWKAWPQIKTLAEGTALSERTVRRALRQLETKQICKRVPHKKGRNANGLCEILLPLLPLSVSPNGGQAAPGPTTPTADKRAPDGGQRRPSTADSHQTAPPSRGRATAARGCPPDLLTPAIQAPVSSGQKACEDLAKGLFMPAKYLGTGRATTADTMAAPQQTREQKEAHVHVRATADSHRPDAEHVLGAIASLRQLRGWKPPQDAQQSPKQEPLTLTHQPADKGAHKGSKEPKNE